MSLNKPLTLIAMLAAVTIAAMSASACLSAKESNRQKAEKARESTMAKAQASVPVPQVTNFENRKAVAEYMKRMDDPNKTFYVYLTAHTGKVIGYYVTRTHPISICSLMTPPDNAKYHGNGGTTVTQAPTLNGLYANGGDGCDHYYAFTADSDTMIEFSQDFFISDQPLDLEADQLTK